MTETQSDDLADWLTQIWDEQEKLARAAQDDAPSLTWEAEKVYDGVYTIQLGPSEHPDNDSYDVGWDVRMPREIARYIAANDPASVLARIAADRQILAMHTGNHECPSVEDNCGWVTDDRCSTVRLLALPYADRPGYQESWKL